MPENQKPSNGTRRGPAEILTDRLEEIQGQVAWVPDALRRRRMPTLQVAEHLEIVTAQVERAREEMAALRRERDTAREALQHLADLTALAFPDPVDPATITRVLRRAGIPMTAEDIMEERYATNVERWEANHRED